MREVIQRTEPFGPTRRRGIWGSGLLALTLWLSGCGSSDAPAGGSEPPPGSDSSAACVPDEVPMIGGECSELTPERFPGLEAPVTIYHDPWGVPHIESEDPRAMAFGFGYAEASSRLFLMDVVRRIGQGRSAELLGEGAYDDDVVMRREFYDADDFDRQIDALPEDIVLMLQRYADGVNRAIVEQILNPLALPVAYIALADLPRPWTVRDSASVLNLFTAVSFAGSGEGGELSNLDRFMAVQDMHGDDGLGIWDDVMWSRDPDMQSVIPDTDAAPVPRGLEGLDTVRPHPDQLALADGSGAATRVEQAMEAQMQRLRALLDRLPVPRVGSYAVAIGGDRTASGGALMLGAPQAGMTFPSTFHEVGIQTPGWRCQGMTVPGLGPLLGIGWCNDHAWTLVAGNAGDQVDVYVETLDPADPGRYLYNGESLPFEERTETFLVKSTLPALETVLGLLDGNVPDGLEAVLPELAVRQERFLYSRHGAVFEIDEEAGVAYTTRRAQSGRSVQNYEGLFRVNQAQDGVPEIMEHLAHFTASYNFTVADRAGNIGYAFTGLQPIRAEGFDLRFAMPGTGQAEWQGFIPPEERPQVINPTGDLLVVNQGVESKPVQWWPAGSSQQIGRVNRVAANWELFFEQPQTQNRSWDADALAAFDRALIETHEPFTQYFATHIDAAFEGLDPEDDADLLALRPHWEAWRDLEFIRSDDSGDDHFDQVGAAIFQPDRYYGMPASPLWTELYEATVGAWLPEGGANWSHYFARLSLLKRVLDGDAALSQNYLDHPDTATAETAAARLRDALSTILPQLAERYGSDDPADWRIPVTRLSFDAAGLSAPGAMTVLDRGTYNFVVDLETQDARSILPPGNASADTILDEGQLLVIGDLPRHADDQIARYEAWDYKPMHRLDYDVVAEEVQELTPWLP